MFVCITTVLFGFPPKEVRGEPEQALSHLGVKSGHTIIVQEEKGNYITATATAASAQASPSPASSSASLLKPSLYSTCTLRKVEIKDDNSCLFNAVSYCVGNSNNGSRKDHNDRRCGNRSAHEAGELRQIVASIVLSDENSIYTTAMLEGKTKNEYVNYILNPDRWGGAIELNILSSYFECEIAAVDVQTMNLYIYGEHNEPRYKRRCYLAYSGIHYDALVVDLHNNHTEVSSTPPSLSSSSLQSLRVFDTATVGPVHDRVIQWVKEANRTGQFTNTYNFTLRCSVCKAGFQGTREATEHAQESGHTSFEEYK